ncbi:hypothetical protein SAMN05421682_102292 [Chryseobacterium indoltheticum]|uniref:Uncharacterized protein n=1 Tax=Chryseobacterium indoltheticum TaxID=254 RepID=A0A381FHE6_9FLAO|nr:hypothetical protein EG358_12590 [Chryseobacterium indoltheticum]SIQ08534.1 hypothetical protein SAMN05421682_102292 [Chryseobacterium indoltheticum]SUX45562.1 Uncharacterised protein [Chryseobacterium indoltheticum]
MKNKTTLLLILLVFSVFGNIYLFTENKKMKVADQKKLKIFTEVSDSLSYFRMQRDSTLLSQH